MANGDSTNGQGLETPQQYTEEKKFLKEEETKNNNLYKARLKNKFFINLIIIVCIGWGLTFIVNMIMLDKVKQSEIRMAKMQSYVFNVSQGVMKMTQKEQFLQEICKVALVYNRNYNEARLYKVADMIYTVGYLKYGIPIDELILLFSLESEWNRRAVSSAGAKGLGQLMVPTARWACAELAIPYEGDETLFNDVINVRLSLFVYSKYKEYFDDKLIWYLTAYNWGETEIRYIYNANKKLTGKYLVYYKNWKTVKAYVEKILERKLDVPEQ